MGDDAPVAVCSSESKEDADLCDRLAQRGEHGALGSRCSVDLDERLSPDRPAKCRSRVEGTRKKKKTAAREEPDGCRFRRPLAAICRWV